MNEIDKTKFTDQNQSSRLKIILTQILIKENHALKN